MLHHVQNAFNAGEVTPYINAREELEVYQSGCSRMENFIALPYGGARYRPGTELINETKSSGEVRLFGFEFSTEERHILEFGAGYIRFYRCGLNTAEQIESSPGVAFERVTPYSVADLNELQFAQLNDVVFITHADHPPYRLSRFAENDWVMEEYELSEPPFLDVELDSTKAITASAETGSVTLTAASDVFVSGHVGAVFELAYKRESTELQVSQDIVGGGSDSLTVYDIRSSSTTARTGLSNSDPIRVEGEFTIQTFGEWTADVRILRRYLGSTEWNDYLFFDSADDRNVNEAYTIDAPADLMISVENHTSSTNARAVLSVADPFIRGRVKIDAVASATSATGTVLRKLAPGASTEWREGAFSTYRGFPRAVTFHGQRLWFGGTVSRPQTVWASRIDGFDDFTRAFATDAVADADAPLSFSLFADEHNRVQWLSSNRSLLAGTTAGEFVITGETREEQISIDDYTIRRHTSKGSKAYQALSVDQAVIFIQRQGRRLRQLGYKFEDDAYKSDDVTIYSEHLTRGNMKELALQRQREAIIWGVTDDGKMIGWTYRPGQPFFAAYEITSPDVTYESVATVYGDGDEDEVWIVVNRGGSRYIERFRPDQILAQEKNTLADLWFVDSAVSYTGATATCTGLSHLDGEEVSVFADGSFAGTATVVSGQITNPSPTASKTVVGIHYGGEIQTLPVEVGTENGTSQGRTKQAGRGVIRLFKSLTGEWFTSQSTQAHPFQSLRPSDSLVEARDLADFDTVLESHSGVTRSLTIGVRQTKPYPMTVLSILARITLKENA
jgi:hypothetical protein